ncbi:hypothetical protein [Methylocystis rosea]|uniref:Uncharacterized protein n=1 Tax=Methylocystis rosea TaxID=173366 RepID=A0A3G8M6W0_9HYPH|nr:hypothetical protein [Methylocystis rosea]AZG77631.1 hypothetical protein EHO51_13315 [Methylocystis rosea]
MEAVKQWFQDWSDACEYAKECAPDFSFLKSFAIGEPYTALISIAGVCWLVWALNERAIKRKAARLRAKAVKAESRAESRDAAPRDMPAPVEDGKKEKLAA